MRAAVLLLFIFGHYCLVTAYRPVPSCGNRIYLLLNSVLIGLQGLLVALVSIQYLSLESFGYLLCADECEKFIDIYYVLLGTCFDMAAKIG